MLVGANQRFLSLEQTGGDTYVRGRPRVIYIACRFHMVETNSLLPQPRDGTFDKVWMPKDRSSFLMETSDLSENPCKCTRNVWSFFF